MHDFEFAFSNQASEFKIFGQFHPWCMMRTICDSKIRISPTLIFSNIHIIFEIHDTLSHLFLHQCFNLQSSNLMPNCNRTFPASSIMDSIVKFQNKLLHRLASKHEPRSFRFILSFLILQIYLIWKYSVSTQRKVHQSSPSAHAKCRKVEAPQIWTTIHRLRYVSWSEWVAIRPRHRRPRIYLGRHSRWRVRFHFQANSTCVFRWAEVQTTDQWVALYIVRSDQKYFCDLKVRNVRVIYHMQCFHQKSYVVLHSFYVRFLLACSD